jgi:hypothetical protein
MTHPAATVDEDVVSNTLTSELAAVTPNPVPVRVTVMPATPSGTLIVLTTGVLMYTHESVLLDAIPATLMVMARAVMPTQAVHAGGVQV